MAVGIRIYSRKSWGAAPPRSTPERVSWENKTLFVHHTAIPFKYQTATVGERIEEERAHMRLLQQVAFGRGYADISYNIVIFPSGRRYWGRGPRIKGAHTQGGKSGYKPFYNDHPGVVFAGNFEFQELTVRARKSFEYLRKWMLVRYALARRVWPHRRVFTTACPGRNIHAPLITLSE